MRTMGTVFAVLTGSIVTAGMFFAGVICGGMMMAYSEKRKKEKDNEKED